MAVTTADLSDHPMPDERPPCPVCGAAVPPTRGTRPRKYCTSRCLLKAQRLHNKGRLDGVVAETSSQRRRGKWHTCPECRRRVWVRPSEEVKWRTCSTECAAARRRDRSLPWNRLQQRLREHMAARGLTLKDVATATGLSRATIRRWYQERGRSLTSDSLKRVARFLELSFETALKEAGGTTGEQEMARTGGLNIVTSRPAPGTPRFQRARRKAGQTTRGRRHAAEWNARIRASLIAAGVPEKGAAVLREMQRSPDGQARQRLWQWLRWHPHPTRNEVRSWARIVGDRLGRTDASVLQVWRPYLAARGIWAAGGRPPAERRHYLVGALLERWPSDTRGFWAVAAWWMSASEGRPVEPTELSKWWRIHRANCTQAATLEADIWTAAVDRVPALSRHTARQLVHDAHVRGDAAYERVFGPYLPGETRS